MLIPSGAPWPKESGTTPRSSDPSRSRRPLRSWPPDWKDDDAMPAPPVVPVLKVSVTSANARERTLRADFAI